MKPFGKILILSTVAMGCLASVALAEEIMGRCVMFDKAKNTITIIKDTNNDKANPNFQLPAATYELPSGAEPVKFGKRIKLDTKENKMKYYDDISHSFKTIDFTLVEKKEAVEPSDALVANSKFPVINKEKKTVSIYSKRQKVLTVISVSADAAALSENIYDSGDDLKLSVDGGKITKIEK